MSVITKPGEMFMFPVARKIYCKDCRRFLRIVSSDSGTFYKCMAPKNLEEEVIWEDTWYEPKKHTRKKDYKHPSVRNMNNDCPLFEQNHEETEGDWNL